jgi:hypothetical protein
MYDKEFEHDKDFKEKNSHFKKLCAVLALENAG